jgi:hypothetical protein
MVREYTCCLEGKKVVCGVEGGVVRRATVAMRRYWYGMRVDSSGPRRKTWAASLSIHAGRWRTFLRVWFQGSRCVAGAASVAKAVDCQVRRPRLLVMRKRRSASWKEWSRGERFVRQAEGANVECRLARRGTRFLTSLLKLAKMRSYARFVQEPVSSAMQPVWWVAGQLINAAIRIGQCDAAVTAARHDDRAGIFWLQQFVSCQ